ncbi:hypothetical protein [Leucothrix arctica]|uniref:Alpha/beta hydrolase n=1 Tax=Leucothrix arctica TaxID=1481894 RepID=A0A317C7Y9_9GAMM|nr:hypothetical protein [Leucothrix arctica]PWQ94726.1 hypothetical protein DKT75_15685 [Leucothrix arctica]
MPHLSVSHDGSNIQYFLICYDKLGNEREDDPHGDSGILSLKVIQLANSCEYTDIFLISHGWKGDIPAAIDQYNRWISAMAACKADLDRLQARPEGFNPLIIGLHWPSLPFGVEEHAQLSEDLDPELQSFDVSPTSDDWKDQAIESIADSLEGQEALRAFLDAYDFYDSPYELTDEAFTALNSILATEIQTSDIPTEEQVNVDAGTLFSAIKDQVDKESSSDAFVSFGSTVKKGGVIAGILTQLSAWKMKERARTFGENGASLLLRELQSVTNTDTQFHLMGHSFGTIVVSSAVTGEGGSEVLKRPVNSMMLVQGAVSLWAFCKDIPVKKGTSGYFQQLSNPNYISGPLVVTYTANDTAVKTIYPLMSWTSTYETVSFDSKSYPRHGAIGRFGVQGDGVQIEQLEMLSLNGKYSYKSNTFYNLHSSEYIKENESLFGGAHNDIDHPEVAHAFLSAIT